MKMLIYIVLGALVLFVILLLTGRKSVHNELYIDAKPEVVWQVLTDTDSYSDWNPVMIAAKGNLNQGASMTYTFAQSAEDQYDINAKVAEIVPLRLLNQKGGAFLILTFDHKYELESEGNVTKLTIHEDYRGVGVNFWNPAPVEEAYVKLNEAIKKRAESVR
ncbi:SRPBCC family protein [Gilvibacter sp.]|uniref:SRPBCC family protein n=1 Tax=Gilvibacter sp. TaxID=2729997 RepID=UPI003F4A4D81